MKVLYDYQIFQMQKFGGISKGFCEFISHLPSEIKYEIGVKESDNIYLREYGLKSDFSRLSYPESEFLKGHSFRGKSSLYKFLSENNLIHSSLSVNMSYCKTLVEEGNFDVFHPTFFSAYFLNKIKKPFVLTVHDLTAEFYPEYFGRTNEQVCNRKKLIKQASHIITPSCSTKKDLIDYYDVDERKITVIYRGGPEISQDEYSRVYDFPYILFVGLRDSYKNFKPFVKQARDFLLKHRDINVVCTGRSFSQAEEELFRDLGLSGRFCSIFATESELKSLYRNALCFVFPSESEGFGLPVLEAFSYGCPVLLAHQSCLPEVGGESAFYIKDKGLGDTSDILEVIVSMSKEEIAAVRERGYCQLKKFSWAKGSQLYANVYKSLI